MLRSAALAALAVPFLAMPVHAQDRAPQIDSIFSFGDMRSQNNSNGYTLFHTRRIGREPQRSIGGSDITFVDAPLETTIAGAAKLTGRSRSGWSMGILDAVTMKRTWTGDLN